MAQKQVKRSKTKESKIKIPSGWDTSDENEIARRRLRALEDKAMRVVPADTENHPYFGDFTVQGENGNLYNVEIRSLTAQINSCSCVDYKTNGLGTCKHIEKVLLILEKKGKRKLARAAQEGSSRVEIYADPVDGRVKILWSKGCEGAVSLQTLRSFFSADRSLIADPETALPALRRTVDSMSSRIRKTVRLSQSLNTIRDSVRETRRKREARAFFLEDVTSGKRTLDILKLPLYEYQREGMLHLAFTERAILADEMGLGKTVQAVAACELLRRLHGVSKVLVVTPTSLKAEWAEQIETFSGLPALPVYGNRAERLRLYQKESFFYLTNYEKIMRDHADIQRLIDPDVIILDEAQRIKNWRTKTAATIKSLQSRYAFVLTGTPIENRIDDIYSIVQFLDPHLFGPLFRFNREFYDLDERGKPKGYKNLDKLHQRLKPILLRRRKKDVEGQLPSRTDKNVFVPMDEEQQLRYAEYELTVAALAAKAARKPLLEAEFKKLQMALASMRMLCDTPYILDQECRICPKLEELEPVLDEILADEDTKIIIFSEWERMLMLVREALEARDIGYAWHTGSVNQKKRPAEIRRFKDDPACRVFLSTDAGATGLNLQAANVVINMDLPWNPAKLEQRIARAWRKHQTRSVQVVNMVSENTIEHRMLSVLKMKKTMADNVLEDGGEASMAMPSGRKAVVERLNEIMGDENPVPAEEQEKPLDRFRQDTLARLEPRLQKMDAYESEGKQTILAVVEGDPAQPKAQMEEALAGSDTNAALEVLDTQTYATIKRLIKAGLLSLNDAAKAQTLHRRAAPVSHAQNEEQKRTARVRILLDQADRKHKAAALMLENGFSAESQAPAREAFRLILHAFAARVSYDAAAEKDDIPLETIDKILVRKHGLPEEALILAMRLQGKADDDTMKTALPSLETLRGFVTKNPTGLKQAA